jgi:multiple sugar transport system substrate-binding protein
MRGRLLLSLAGWLGVLGCGGERDSTPRLTVAAAILTSEQTAYQEIAREVGEGLGIEVEVIARQYDDIRRALEAEVQAGRGTLDVVEADVFALATMAPMMRVLPDPPDLAALNTEAVEAGVIGGERRFLPHRLSWQAMIYDSEALGQPPATWDELMAVAEHHSGAIGIKADAYEGLSCDILPFLWQAGGDPLDPSAAGNAEALRFLQRLGPHLNPACRGYREGEILTALEHGEIVLHFNWPFAVAQLREAGTLPSRFRTAPLPAGPAGSATVLGGGYLGVSVVAPHPDEASRFVAAMTSAAAQRQLVSRMGWFPVREDAWDALGEAERGQFAGFIAMRGDIHARPVSESYPEISALWQEAFRRVVFEGEASEAVMADIAARMPGG